MQTGGCLLHELPARTLETVTRIDLVVDALRVDVSKAAIRSPFRDRAALSFQDNLARAPLGLVAEDGTVVSSLPVVALLLPKPAEYHVSLSGAENHRATGRHELIRSRFLARIVPICQQASLNIELANPHQRVTKFQQHHQCPKGVNYIIP